MITNHDPSIAWAKLVAHASFDGNIHESPDKGARVRFYSTNRNHLEELKSLIKKEVGLVPYRNDAFEERGKLLLRYNNSNFTRKLISLGAVSGDKAIQEYRVPKWIREGNKEVKLSYIGAMIDDEAESITKIKKNTLRGLKIKQSKWVKHKDGLRVFLKDIKDICSSLGIQTGTITIDEKHKYQREDGKETVAGWVRISLSKNNQKLLVKSLSSYSRKIKVITDLTGWA